MSSGRFQACVVGHVTRDIVTLPGSPPKIMPGGTAYYSAIAFASLGLATAVITRVAREDEGLLDGLRGAGIRVFCKPSNATTVYDNSYPDPCLDVRRQKVGTVADPFSIDDIPDMEAAAFHVGTSTNKDLSPGVVETLARKKGLLSFDVQGLLRNVNHHGVALETWNVSKSDFAGVDILKADIEEARILTNEQDPACAAQHLARLGPREVIVTMGSQGSVVVWNDTVVRIPACTSAEAVDATGCGDTYMAGYIARRLKGEDPQTAAKFAAVLATLKLERSGPFTGCEADVVARL